MKRYNVELGLLCEPDDESGFARLMTEIDEPVYLASDVADLEHRLSEAVEIIEQYHEWFDIAMCSACGAVSMAYADECGKDPYHDEAIGICKRARAFLAEEET